LPGSFTCPDATSKVASYTVSVEVELPDVSPLAGCELSSSKALSRFYLTLFYLISVVVLWRLDWRQDRIKSLDILVEYSVYPIVNLVQLCCVFSLIQRV
jgi:hypothetical protein